MFPFVPPGYVPEQEEETIFYHSATRYAITSRALPTSCMYTHVTNFLLLDIILQHGSPRHATDRGSYLISQAFKVFFDPVQLLNTSCLQRTTLRQTDLPNAPQSYPDRHATFLQVIEIGRHTPLIMRLLHIIRRDVIRPGIHHSTSYMAVDLPSIADLCYLRCLVQANNVSACKIFRVYLDSVPRRSSAFM